MVRTRTDGFSLVELMIVVGLIAVLGGMTVPQIVAGMRQYSVISASQQVVSTIRSARVQAVGRNSRVRVRFDEAAGEFQSEIWNGAAWVVLSGVNQLADGLSFDGPVDILFETNGRMAGAAVNFNVTNGEGYDRTIAVSTSGQVRLQ